MREMTRLLYLDHHQSLAEFRGDHGRLLLRMTASASLRIHRTQHGKLLSPAGGQITCSCTFHTGLVSGPCLATEYDRTYTKVAPLLRVVFTTQKTRVVCRIQCIYFVWLYVLFFLEKGLKSLPYAKACVAVCIAVEISSFSMQNKVQVLCVFLKERKWMYTSIFSWELTMLAPVSSHPARHQSTSSTGRSWGGTCRWERTWSSLHSIPQNAGPLRTQTATTVVPG